MIRRGIRPPSASAQESAALHRVQALQYLLETEYHGDYSWMVSRLLLFQLLSSEQLPRNIDWQVASLLWRQLVRLHLSREEQLTILCSRTFLGRRVYGFSAGARAWFGKSLDSLDEPELASLVVLQRWPTYFGRPENADRLRKSSEDLLERKRATFASGEGSPRLTSSINP